MTSRPAPARSQILPSRLHWAGYLLGFSLSGFFDGILLHQVLQWHHLLSALDSSTFRDIRVQILADGLFHVLMYAVAAVGLWLLWRSRRAFAEPGSGRTLLAVALIGFGVWHVLDAVLSHWILGIHRIRMDSPVPLAWDLGWALVFGLVPILAGILLDRRGGGGNGRGRQHRSLAPAALAAAVLVAGPVAALPPPGTDTVMVLFRPGMSGSDAFGALAAVDARPVWSDPTGQLWAVEMGVGGRASALYAHGALLVGTGLLPAGCLAWSSA
ncbi:MAG TPA: DUF2243 domain-containing protein [Geminicoccus sp.]|jgi:uncharacterized membrane protein|uniref:DUF2243 domain-containing protein n=1 Tax=Geminicoccus sp. TaxID=2024832 RepID=UPI002E2F2F12|nr:DUF2243 domain-containing protein [Geminicoccus sp.]HEX2528986.1 DUF2243 domain-containing protein [Geminicoccus sp.]